jgi:hypothetical protein
LEIFKCFDLNPIPLDQKIENNIYFTQAARSDRPKAPGSPTYFFYFFFLFLFSEIGPPSAPGPLGPIIPFPPRVKQPRPPPATDRSAAALLTFRLQLSSRAPPLHLKRRYQ